MNILYLHGLNSFPKPEKIDYLNQHATQIFAPHINYETDKNVLSDLITEYDDKKLDYIIGSSMGGLIAFWLAKHFQVDTLLFNPPLHRYALSNQHLFAPVKDLKEKDYINNIVLGELDTIVKPTDVVIYLKENVPQKLYRYEIIKGLGHQIDLENFKKSCQKYIFKADA
ncbi:MAG: hypothetical protein NZ551_09420 [Microscillaceae bacterium]|nr:hypothetical protein [Microscillaceae bacterium]MDW8461420.1 YqiA/YcfP family alpha/beta fold hydrolase [Cytophagales bacterium]